MSEYSTDKSVKALALENHSMVNTMNPLFIILLCLFCIFNVIFMGCKTVNRHTTDFSHAHNSYTVPAKPYVVMHQGDTTAVIVNNEAVDDEVLPRHRAGYSGLASLTHTRRSENLFVPPVSGLNFEHIHDGTVKPMDIIFEPRRVPMEIRQIDNCTVELYQPPTTNWQLESYLRYHLLEDGVIELTLECIPRQRTFKHDYIGLFFASYINQPESLDIHFLGYDENQTSAPLRWIRGITPAHGKLATHRFFNDQRSFPHDPNFPATLVFGFSNYRYGRPWYYGLSHGMALVMMFRQKDMPRFTQSPCGGGKGNPAWDFQWFIPDYKVGRSYRFVMRAMYVPFESPAQIEKLIAPHLNALNPE